jgi:transposase
VLHRRLVRERQKRGLCVGKTKRGKGTKIMAIADRSGLPAAAWIESATPHEVRLVEDTLDAMFVDEDPEHLIGDKAYDSDGLDDRLAARGIEMIAPNIRRPVRHRPPQDGRPLRRYKRRWRMERLFAWLQNFRRLVTRYEYHAPNYLGFLWLACFVILARGL